MHNSKFALHTLQKKVVRIGAYLRHGRVKRDTHFLYFLVRLCENIHAGTPRRNQGGIWRNVGRQKKPPLLKSKEGGFDACPYVRLPRR